VVNTLGVGVAPLAVSFGAEKHVRCVVPGGPLTGSRLLLGHSPTYREKPDKLFSFFAGPSARDLLWISCAPAVANSSATIYRIYCERSSKMTHPYAVAPEVFPARPIL